VAASWKFSGSAQVERARENQGRCWLQGTGKHKAEPKNAKPALRVRRGARPTSVPGVQIVAHALWKKRPRVAETEKPQDVRRGRCRSESPASIERPNRRSRGLGKLLEHTSWYRPIRAEISLRRVCYGSVMFSNLCPSCCRPVQRQAGPVVRIELAILKVQTTRQVVTGCVL